MKIRNILLAGGLFLLGACSESEYELGNLVPEQYHKILYVNNSGKQEVTLFDTDADNIYTFSVFKGGSNPDQSAGADIKVLSQADVDREYSQLEGVNYKVISADCYALDVTRLDFAVEDRYKLITVSLKPQSVKKLIETDPESVWVLPLQVVSETDSVNTNKSELFLHIEDVIMPTLGFANTDVEVNQYAYGSVSTISKNIAIGLDTENKWDIDFLFDVDQAYIQSYNNEHGTAYQLLPEGNYAFSESMSLINGITNSSLKVSVSGDQLQPGDYMLPIRIANISLFKISSTKAIYPLAIRIMAPELDRINWTAEANTEELSGEGSSGKVKCVLDGNLNTYWHSMWQSGINPGMPYEIIVDTRTEHTFSQFAMMQRQNSSYTDTASGKFYVSSDKQEWLLVGSFSMEKILDVQMFGVIPTKGRYFKVVVESSHRGNNASLTEIYAYGF